MGISVRKVQSAMVLESAHCDWDLGWPRWYEENLVNAFNHLQQGGNCICEGMFSEIKMLD